MAKSLVDDARASVANLIGGRSQEIIFTSGGTESDNLAIRGVAQAAAISKRRRLVVSSIEHEAVLNTVKALGKIGWSTTFLSVDDKGIVLPEVLSEAITDDTALVSVMHANNEIGTVQPIPELARIAHRHGALFHTDAVQSTGKISVSVDELGVDLLSLSSHKFNGPKGVGALWVNRGSRLAATMTGGRQERNRRAGTENVPGISALGAAARLAAEKLADRGETDTAELRNRLETGILANVPSTFVNGNRADRVPNTTNISFDRVEAESLLIALDLEGVAVSTGSACSSGTLEPSHVLRAMGLSPHRTQNSIRFSLGLGNTNAQIDHVIKIMPRVVEKLRTLSRSGSPVRS
jgi:cysteine desulfurase